MASQHRRHTVVGSSPRPAAHAARPRVPTARLIGIGAGAIALLIGVGLATSAVLGAERRSGSTPPSAQFITVSAPAGPRQP